jgi:uncharacterized protein
MEFALITGASRGIGTELAREMAAVGVPSILVARAEEELKRLSDEIESDFGLKCKWLSCDLTLDEERRNLFRFCEEHALDVAYLINNAGFGTYGEFVDIPVSRNLSLIELNISALTHLCYLFLPSMLAKGKGRIMNVASVAAFMPGPNAAVYFASKAYVLNFSEALHQELKGKGITVTTLCPGPTESEFMKVSGMENSSMVHGKKLDDARKVAKKGVSAMRKGQRVYIYGIINKILAYSAKWTPRSIGLSITAMLQKPVKK